jgi:hypothetical protein
MECHKISLMALLREFPLTLSHRGTRRDLKGLGLVKIKGRKSRRMACRISGNRFQASRSLVSEPLSQTKKVGHSIGSMIQHNPNHYLT